MSIIIASFGLLIVDVLTLTGMALALHYLSTRYGISLLLMYIATVVGILTYADPLIIFLEPVPNIILTIPTDFIVPTILSIILVLYIVDGTEITQLVIFGIALIQLIVGLIFIVISMTIRIPTASALVSDVVFTDVLQVNLQTMISGVIAFVADMFVIAFLYQGVSNVLKKQNNWLAIGIALIGSLWTDAIVFNFLAEIGQGGFATFIPGDIISKSVTALVLFPIITLYLNRFSSRFPTMSKHNIRSTFDIFHNLFGDWRIKILQLEAELRDTEINTQQLIANIQEVFWMADQGDQQSYFISPAFDRMLGIKRGEYYLDPAMIYTMVHDEDADAVRNQWLTYTNRNHDIEFRIIGQDGKTRWLRDRTYCVQDSDMDIDRVIGITEDITSQKEQQTLVIEIEIEREKLKFLHELIREVSHDIQSPLAALSIKVDLLERVKGDAKREKRYLHELKKQTQQLSELVEHLFTLIKIESRIETLDEVCNFHEVCQDVFDELHPVANNKQLDMRIELAETQPFVRCNISGLRRVVDNLIGNAIRYTPTNGMIHVETHVQDGTLTMIVRDNGIGISKQDIHHIFDRFYRASNTQDVHGTGLGLAIAKQIVHQMDGTIRAESELNKGSTFTVTLPLIAS